MGLTDVVKSEFGSIVVTRIRGVDYSFDKFQRIVGEELKKPEFIWEYTLNGKTIYLDTPEFNGMQGVKVIGLATESDRARCVIVGNVIIEQKGVTISKRSPELHPASWDPNFVLLISKAKSEYENGRLAATALPYSVDVHDLGLTVTYNEPPPNNPSATQIKSKIGILERRGKLEEFTPNIRMGFWYTPGFSHLGLSIDDAFWTAGYQMGAIHECGVYLLNRHFGNIDAHGNHLDLTGSPNKDNLETYVNNFRRVFEKLRPIYPLPTSDLGATIEILEHEGALFFEALGLTELFAMDYYGAWALPKLIELMSQNHILSPSDGEKLMKRSVEGYFAARIGREKAAGIVSNMELKPPYVIPSKQVLELLTHVHGEAARQIPDSYFYTTGLVTIMKMTSGR